MSEKVSPQYKCCSCGHRWETDFPYTAMCPDCGYISYEWINYAKWREANMKDGH